MSVLWSINITKLLTMLHKLKRLIFGEFQSEEVSHIEIPDKLKLEVKITNLNNY